MRAVFLFYPEFQNIFLIVELVHVPSLLPFLFCQSSQKVNKWTAKVDYMVNIFVLFQNYLLFASIYI